MLQHAKAKETYYTKNPDTKGPIFLNLLAKEASGLDKSLSTEGRCVVKEQRGKKKRGAEHREL